MAHYLRLDQQHRTLWLQGDWTLSAYPAIQQEIKSLGDTKMVEQVDASDLGLLDSAGALLLLQWLHDVRDVPVHGLGDAQEALLKMAAKVEVGTPPRKRHKHPVHDFVEHVGKASYDAVHISGDLLAFVGEATSILAKAMVTPHRLRWASILRHVEETGINAIPIVGLIAFLISLVLAYQAVDQLRKFGAEIFTVDMVALSVLREMGVLLTAIMIAGRSGSAFTAEIGVMKVNEEVDAMRVIGINPFEVLVLPRLIALMITLPILTFFADMMGLFAGGVICYFLIDIPVTQYLSQLHQVLSNGSHFYVGLIKAPVFAFLIGTVGCMRGMQVEGSAESVGRLTTSSVVQSIFLVLLADALFSILFSKLGI